MPQMRNKPRLEHRQNRSIRVIYTNYKGETAERHIVPRKVYWGSNEYHPEPQWLMLVWDMDKKAYRDFALRDMQVIT